MAKLDEYKPLVAIIAAQFISAVMAVFTKAALTEGLRPMVFVVYRQAIAALILFPASILSRRGTVTHLSLGSKGFWLVFLTALIGFTMNECFYYQGLKLTTSSMTVAIVNLVPALTFVMAASTGLEKVNLKSIRSKGKILGTIICIGGAIAMGLYKGQKLAGMEISTITEVNLHFMNDKWFLGFLFLLASIFCWSLWFILQVPICSRFLDPLSVTTWTCFFSSIQSAAATFFLEPDSRVWKITSSFQLLCCIYAATFGTAVNFYLQTWCIKVRGPLFCAMFNPLSTVITTILAYMFLHEALYLGSLLGSVAVVIGLYMVLWGKVEDHKPNSAGSSQVDLILGSGDSVNERFLE
ncbi:WAT1-related protein [Platanthera zijinensis]|uniref:WAT1-related protein n=1 Tax=Platanthera zijinensis TaxID=2320716 RepID=A0AAP0AXY7_9ASPA